MKISNIYNLPAALVRAASADNYDKPDGYSITELINPAWQAKLFREHGEEIVEDVTDRIYTMIGHNTHDIIQRAKRPDDRAEERLMMLFDGDTVSGKYDLYETDTRTLNDFKATSVWAVKMMLKDGVKPDYVAQLNAYGYLLRRNGQATDRLQLVALCRDWSKREFMYNKDYPPAIVSFDVPIWTDQECEQFLYERLQAHRSDNPAVCSDAERWHRPGKVAVMKKGRKTALRLLDTQGEAMEYMAKHDYQGPTYYLEARPGSNPRCELYCSVNEYCSFYRETLDDGNQ